MEFRSFNKIARFSREMIVTEKIDGTNGIIAIGENGEFQIGSRNKWLTDELGNIQSDNAGFAQWAIKNRDSLMALGAGYHYGEWWGSGIQRGYDLPKGEKRFSLFNVSRWSDDSVRPACCHVVPTLYSGIFSYAEIERIPYMAPGLVGEEKAEKGKTLTDTWWHTIVPTNGKEKTGYPTQKPLGILRRIVKVSSNQDSTVLDFFAGSGTTGVASLENDRNFILVDKNLESLEVMAKRFDGVTNIEWVNFDPTRRVRNLPKNGGRGAGKANC
jgi:hypothetical protein